jgi:hypothetical protein
MSGNFPEEVHDGVDELFAGLASGIVTVGMGRNRIGGR